MRFALSIAERGLMSVLKNGRPVSGSMSSLSCWITCFTTQFTCFTSTRLDPPYRAVACLATQFACFTCTNVQTRTPKRPVSGSMSSLSCNRAATELQQSCNNCNRVTTTATELQQLQKSCNRAATAVIELQQSCNRAATAVTELQQL